MNQLEQLKQFTTVVADTGDFESMHVYAPRDATTNPSLILRAAQQSNYRYLLESVVAAHLNEPADGLVDRLLVRFGCEILKIVPGRVSTEVDARLSFDVAATVAKAHELIALYEGAGVRRERVLIKIASTWEGIRSAEILEREGIHCNLTLLFSLIQATASADAGATLISPFVGRITDWYKRAENRADYAPSEDPGVRSLKAIYATLKNLHFRTEIMGASFRTREQILELAGCDLLTISPSLLAELQAHDEVFQPALSEHWATNQSVEDMIFDESEFRWDLNADAMATEKLAEGIRLFAKDSKILEELVMQVQARMRSNGNAN